MDSVSRQEAEQITTLQQAQERGYGDDSSCNEQPATNLTQSAAGPAAGGARSFAFAALAQRAVGSRRAAAR